MALRIYSEKEILAFKTHLRGVRGPDNLSQISGGYQWDDLHSVRAAVRKGLRSLLDRTEEEKRDLSAEERTAFDVGSDVIDNLSNHIDARLELNSKGAGAPFSGGTTGPFSAMERWHTRDGKPILVLGREARMSELVRGDDGSGGEIGFGQFVRAMVLGPQSDVERRALAEGADATGGFTVPMALSAELIDRMRSKSTVISAGARTVPLTTDKTVIARLSGDPTATWRAENALINESDPTFEGVTFNVKTLAAVVRVSRELVEDSVNINEALPNAFAQSMGLELDRVALLGSGTGEEPRGIHNTSGVGSVSMGTNGAQLSSFAKILDALQALQEANAEDPTAAILAPRTWRTIAGFVDTTGQPLRLPPALEKIPFMSTTQIPMNQTQGTASNASSITLGNFPELLIGVRTSLRVEVLRERYAEYLQYGFLAYLRADIQLAHPASFCAVKGIIP